LIFKEKWLPSFKMLLQLHFSIPKKLLNFIALKILGLNYQLIQPKKEKLL